MEQEAPKIDQRSAPDIFRQVEDLLKEMSRAPGADQNWKDFEPSVGASGAMINIFARYGELIIERLNQVPEKNLLAFLDLLGGSLLPPRAARAPLTFSLVEGATTDAVVPAGTQVGATEGEKQPVVFETERDTVITAARLTSAFARNPQVDKYADYSSILPQSAENQEQETVSLTPANAISVFEGNESIEHILYIAHDGIFNHPGNRTKLEIKFALSGQGSLEVTWETWDGAKWNPVTGAAQPIITNTALAFNDFTPSQPVTIAGIEKRWLRCLLKDAVTPTRQLPNVSSISLDATYEKRGTIDKAFTNNFPVDAGRGFYPFGESPRAGDIFYLSIDEAFTELNCKMTLGAESSLITPPSDTTLINPALTWEFWSGTVWEGLGNTTKEGSTGISDGTKAFTQKGNIEFTFSKKPAATAVNGVEGYWLRVRISSGSYGPGASLKPVYDNSAPPKIINYESTPATAPLITSITATYKTEIKDEPPEIALAYNDFSYEIISGESLKKKTPFTPFKPPQDKHQTFYLGFELPAALSVFPNNKFSLYVCASGEKKSDQRPKIEWEYSTGEQWAELIVRDGTDDLTQPSLIEFLAPPDFAPRAEFELSRYWLRAILKSGEYKSLPRFSCVLLNTVMASHATSIKDEVLGSSDGSKNQTFRTALAPVLEGERIEVREHDFPSPAEQEVITKENGADAIRVTRDEAGRPVEIWVTWKQVADFYGSGPRDRHYTIDYLAGEIRFGDGLSGMIPPTGDAGVRMASYRTGGGATGNRTAGSITELKTTVPYVEKVINHVAASGGAEAETHDSLLDRLPRAIRHGGRAVTFEDYEDLARLASPETARAKCVQDAPGKLKLIVVPHSTDNQPVPGTELKRRVLEFINANKSPLADIEIINPEYVVVSVTVQVAPISLEIANDLRLNVAEKLTRFFHPLTGGFDGKGWDFGRQPHESDLYYLIEAIPGVDHMITLAMNPPEEDEQFKKSNFLISSGKHSVTCEFTKE